MSLWARFLCWFGPRTVTDERARFYRDLRRWSRARR